MRYNTPNVHPAASLFTNMSKTNKKWRISPTCNKIDNESNWRNSEKNQDFFNRTVYDYIFLNHAIFIWESYVYWTVHHLDSWIKREQLDVTCFIISLFTAQHVSDVNTCDTYWAVNNEIIKQVTSSWPLFIQLLVWQFQTNTRNVYQRNFEAPLHICVFVRWKRKNY